jgi:hypothetical protein
MQAVGDAAVVRIRAYVQARLPGMTLSEEERAAITKSLGEVKYVLSAASWSGRFSGLRTREPDHPFFKPKFLHPEGSLIEYTTETGQKFQVETEGDLPTRVVGSNLTPFIGRGVTQDSPYFVASQDFNRAHVIANRFGGSGYRSAKNLVTTSRHYNQTLMAGAEDEIAAYVDGRAKGADTRVRATVPPQAAVVTFTLTVQLAYVDAIIRLINEAIAKSVPDKSNEVREQILAKLAEAKIDQKMKRVASTDYTLENLTIAGQEDSKFDKHLPEDKWLLSELGG